MSPFGLPLHLVVMDSWVGIIVFLVLWVALQVWILPRLGVPT